MSKAKDDVYLTKGVLLQPWMICLVKNQGMQQLLCNLDTGAYDEQTTVFNQLDTPSILNHSPIPYSSLTMLFFIITLDIEDDSFGHLIHSTCVVFSMSAVY